jgi:tetratricopeptide (TPR) repeat protein
MTDAQKNAPRAFSLAGKWQMPLLMVSLVACGLAFWHWIASAPKESWDDRFAAVQQAAESYKGTDFAPIEQAALKVFEEIRKDVPQNRAAECEGRAYLLLGDIRWRSMTANNDWSRGQFEALERHYRFALEVCGQPATPERAERLGRACEELGQPAKAVQWYNRAVAKDAARRARLDRRVIEMALRDRSMTGEDLLARLKVYLRAEGLDGDSYGWALDRAIDILLEMKRPDRADELLAAERIEVAAHGEAAPVLRHVEYQQARIWARRGWTEQADNHLIQLIPQVPPTTPLYSKACLLRGQLIRQDNPMEAEELFRNVLAHSPRTPLAVAASEGLACAYADQHEYDKALSQYSQALEGLLEQRDNPYVNLADLRRSLIANHQLLMEAGRPADALGFVIAEKKLFELPSPPFAAAEHMEMFERLGATHLALAAQAAEALAKATAGGAAAAEMDVLAGKRVDHLVEAGKVFRQRAKLAERIDVRLYGSSLWQAADAFYRAGKREETISTLEAFIASQPADTRVPEARFLLGQALQASGKYDEAIAVYDENLKVSQPPGRHAKAVEGLIPMAMCYVAKGKNSYPKAEEILVSIIDGEGKVFTPDSEQYHSALYALGWLCHRQEKWPQAQKVLGEAIQRSPGKLLTTVDGDCAVQRERFCRATRAMFLTADSYHCSARELARSAQQETKQRVRRQQEEARDEQLARADELFAQVISRVEQLDEPRSELDETYRRNSYFSRGDCQFELKNYEQALQRYEEAVFHFQTQPAALGGLMQQYNCYVALGKPGEARVAIERARQLRKQIPDAAFEGPDAANTPQSWDQWFDTVERMNPAVSQEPEELK